jgi:hypothetical protein
MFASVCRPPAAWDHLTDGGRVVPSSCRATIPASRSRLSVSVWTSPPKVSGRRGPASSISTTRMFGACAGGSAPGAGTETDDLLAVRGQRLKIASAALSRDCVGEGHDCWGAAALTSPGRSAQPGCDLGRHGRALLDAPVHLARPYGFGIHALERAATDRVGVAVTTARGPPSQQISQQPGRLTRAGRDEPARTP